MVLLEELFEPFAPKMPNTKRYIPSPLAALRSVARRSSGVLVVGDYVAGEIAPPTAAPPTICTNLA
jgi:hypothetical protein